MTDDKKTLEIEGLEICSLLISLLVAGTFIMCFDNWLDFKKRCYCHEQGITVQELFPSDDD